MKRIAIAFFLLFTLSYLYSCGPSAAEQAQIQQHRDDSIKAAVEHKFELQKELTETNNSAIALQRQLENIKATQEAETDRMNKIKEFQFGRTIFNTATSAGRSCSN